jgi:hypothetical protein
MNRRITHERAKGVAFAIVLAVPLVASAPALAVEGRAVPATGQGGLGWPEAAGGVGVVLGVVVLGLWGGSALGAVLAGVDALIAAARRAGASLATRRLRSEGGEAWPRAVSKHVPEHPDSLRPAVGRRWAEPRP